MLSDQGKLNIKLMRSSWVVSSVVLKGAQAAMPRISEGPQVKVVKLRAMETVK
jgi:hypothetical protein